MLDTRSVCRSSLHLHFITLLGISFVPGFLRTVLVFRVVKGFIPVSQEVKCVTPNAPGFPRVIKVWHFYPRYIIRAAESVFELR
jgi:hypothetical protein